MDLSASYYISPLTSVPLGRWTGCKDLKVWKTKYCEIQISAENIEDLATNKGNTSYR